MRSDTPKAGDTVDDLEGQLVGVVASDMNSINVGILVSAELVKTEFRGKRLVLSEGLQAIDDELFNVFGQALEVVIKRAGRFGSFEDRVELLLPFFFSLFLCLLESTEVVGHIFCC